MSTEKVSVIIPNYNGAAYLERCVESLMRQDMSGFEILIVDDGSTDGSAEALQRRYEKEARHPLRFLFHEKNAGFAKSVNDGIRAARAPYVLLLNNDTVAAPDFVRQMYRAIRRGGDILSVSAQMRQMAHPERIDDTGDDYCALGWAYTRGKDRPAARQQRAREVFAACGGAAIYRRRELIELGGFDERHFAYLEDIDVGYRARLHGWRSIYCPRAVVEHAGSGSSGSRYNEFKLRLSPRNNVYLIYKNMPDWQIALNLPLLLAGFGIKYLFFARMGYGRLYRESVREGLRLCRGAREARVDFRRIPAARLWRIEALLLRNTLRRLGA